ncbi:MAG: M56 family metallopeptidase [Bacteroidaceae bacterium]|nr:M56 family metallopeptidase [Bacteroidaceae bacterium]
MIALLTFYGKFLAASAVLLALYWVVLRDRASYRVSRLYLLLLPVASLLLSGPRLEVYRPQPTVVEVTNRPLLTSPLGEGFQPDGLLPIEGEMSEGQRGSVRVFVSVVGLVSAVLLLVALFCLLKMYRLRRQVKSVSLVNGCRVVRLAALDSPFSFMDTIFLPQGMTAWAEDYILRHEQSHVRHRHYIDVWLIELLTRLLWFNPVLWLNRNELRGVHEFEADHDVVLGGVDLPAYQSLLMEYVLTDSSVAANGFTSSFMRRRFVEMRRASWGTWGRVGQWLAVICLLLVFCSFTLKVGDREIVVVQRERSADPDSLQTLSPALPHNGEGEEVTDVAEETLVAEEEKKDEASKASEPDKDNDTPDATRTASPLPITGEGTGERVSSFPLNTSRKVTYNGYYIKRTAEATYLVCVATPESDDEIYNLGSSDNTYIVDEERGVHYRARGSQPSDMWAQDFHVRGMKGQTIALTIVFPPIPENVERVRIYGVGDWNLRGQEFRLKDIEEN